jgi:hypothetical protein
MSCRAFTAAVNMAQIGNGWCWQNTVLPLVSYGNECTAFVSHVRLMTHGLGTAKVQTAARNGFACMLTACRRLASTHSVG